MPASGLPCWRGTASGGRSQEEGAVERTCWERRSALASRGWRGRSCGIPASWRATPASQPQGEGCSGATAGWCSRGVRPEFAGGAVLRRGDAATCGGWRDGRGPRCRHSFFFGGRCFFCGPRCATLEAANRGLEHGARWDPERWVSWAAWRASGGSRRDWTVGRKEL